VRDHSACVRSIGCRFGKIIKDAFLNSPSGWSLTVAAKKTAATGNLQTAPRVLAFGGALVLVTAVTTFGLIRVNQQRDSRVSVTGTEDGKQTASGSAKTGQAGSARSQSSPVENASLSFALPRPSAEYNCVPGVWSTSVASGERTSSYPSPYLSPYNSAMRWAGAETTLTSNRATGDARLERIERQLSQVLRNVDRSDATFASSSITRQNSSAAVAASPATIPASVAAAVTESARAAVAESEIRRELSDLRVTSEAELRQLKQHLAGLSDQQKKLLKSLRKRPAASSTSRNNSPNNTGTVQSQTTSTVSPEAVTQNEATATNQPGTTEQSETEARELATGVTIVSELPLRVSVRTRSTMLSDLLAEFAKATDSGLLISTDLDREIQAISLSEIAPQVLFDLLSQNQDFEIRYEAKRVELRSRQKVPRAEDSGAGVAAHNGSKPDDIALPTQQELVTSVPSIENRPFEDPPAEIATRQASPQPVANLDPDLPGLSEPMPAPASTYPPSELRSENDNESRFSGETTLDPAALSSTLPMPAELPRELIDPIVSTASSRNARSAIPPQAVASRERQTYQLTATVLHLVVTDQQNVQQIGIEPIRLYKSRAPGHRSAAQQVAEQAAKLGRTTPVSEASVSLAEGQSARLKIGWLCLHCNDESGVAAGDTLRVTLVRTENGEPRLVVQALATETSEELSTLGTLEAVLGEGQSLLVTEAGTGGNVSLRKGSSTLARLPVIGRAFQKSKQIYQSAQRLIVLTATPDGLENVEPEPTTVQQTASYLKPESHSVPAASRNMRAPADSQSVTNRFAALFPQPRIREPKNAQSAEPRLIDTRSILSAETVIPRRSSYRPRRPEVRCEYCETTARPLTGTRSSVARQQKEDPTETKSVPLILETTRVAFESEPADVGSAPMIDLPLPSRF